VKGRSKSQQSTDDRCRQKTVTFY